MPPNQVEELRVDVDGVDTFYRRVPGEGLPTLFLHGNPTHSEDWLQFLSAIDGPGIAPDLPGWGRSQRPSGFDYSMHGLAAFYERFLATVGVEEHMLVLHDWGALALIAEQRHPGRLRRLVILNAVPLLSGFRWHWVARLWRRRGVGELLNATTTRPGTALLLRQARPGWKPMPADFVDMIDRHFDAGTKHAVLELYRSADEPRLAAAGTDLGLLACPALVVWGEQDRLLPAKFGAAYADALPNAELLALPDAGHWPWIDRPETIARVLNFLSSA